MKNNKMRTLEEILEEIKNYDGRPVRFMEICGSHTAAITKSGLRSIISDKITLVSGPGCPVCVTPSAYIDKLISLASQSDTVIVTFGDMLRVPGSRESLNTVKGSGCDVRMVYSPMDILEMAKTEPQKRFIFAAVGFETTAPVYALLTELLISENTENVQLLTAIKTMPAAVSWLMENNLNIDGFFAPGHVCAVTGTEKYKELAEKYRVPFVAAGFKDEELLIALSDLLKLASERENIIKNDYPSVVTEEGNTTAQEMLEKYFEPCDAAWRGIGVLKGSGLKLRSEFARFDAGSDGLDEDIRLNKRCCCDKVITGRMDSTQCPLFKKECTPLTPQGACMVSYEGSCYQKALN